MNSIFTISKKELLDNVRNKWIIILTIIFASLTLVVSYFGSIFTDGWQDLGITIQGMMSLVQLLIPIIALMLGYSAIIGEIEKGSMSSLLSLPVTRLEILLGKFIGLGSLLAITIIIGFGLAGIVIGFNVSDVDYLGYIIFIFATIMIGLVFLALALFLSTLFNKRSTAMGGAIFLWFFFNIILPIVFVGILAASSDIINIINNAPDWYHILNLFNPLQVYSFLVTLNVGAALSFDTISIAYPEYYSNILMTIILLSWIICFMILSYWRFNKRDI
ncbi:MAG: ABC transporter permease [Candidatus Thermoplasmatota archaeon]|nr:ABC transporter permease [Candidatus Thermoplasmatota archaeon]